MAKTTMSLFMLLVINIAYSQQYINATKSTSKKIFSKYAEKDTLQTIIKETDSTLNFLVRDPRFKNLDILLHFDKFDKCDRETMQLSCDSCYRKVLSNTIGNKYYRWTKIDDNTYFARFPYRLILTTLADNSFLLVIQPSYLPGYEYRQAIKNASTR